jgi:hypothetical protein
VLYDAGLNPYKEYEFYVRLATEKEYLTPGTTIYGEKYVVEVQELDR